MNAWSFVVCDPLVETEDVWERTFHGNAFATFAH